MNGINSIAKTPFQEWPEVRLVNMHVIHPFRKGPERISYCMTLAMSTEEAWVNARRHYGVSVQLGSWGSRLLPLESPLMGGGYFLLSKHDKNHTESLRFIGQLHRRAAFR